MSDDVGELFDDYAARFLRGERPDTADYLARAGDGVDRLGTLIERFLERVPAPPPDADAVALAEAWLKGQPPLLELRVRRRLRVDQVVDTLVERLRLDAAKREKVKGYYQQLEGGVLEPKRVDRSVLDVLAEVLRARIEDVVAWRPPPSFAETAYLRTERLVPASPAAGPPRAPEPPDEIDRLFGAT
jgi:hypothetical protein